MTVKAQTFFDAHGGTEKSSVVCPIWIHRWRIFSMLHAWPTRKVFRWKKGGLRLSFRDSERLGAKKCRRLVLHHISESFRNARFVNPVWFGYFYQSADSGLNYMITERQGTRSMFTWDPIGTCTISLSPFFFSHSSQFLSILLPKLEPSIFSPPCSDVSGVQKISGRDEKKGKRVVCEKEKTIRQYNLSGLIFGAS